MPTAAGVQLPAATCTTLARGGAGAMAHFGRECNGAASRHDYTRQGGCRLPAFGLVWVCIPFGHINMFTLQLCHRCCKWCPQPRPSCCSSSHSTCLTSCVTATPSVCTCPPCLAWRRCVQAPPSGMGCWQQPWSTCCPLTLRFGGRTSLMRTQVCYMAAVCVGGSTSGIPAGCSMLYDA